MNWYAQLRYDRGLTISDVAEGAGVSRPTVKSVEALGVGEYPSAKVAKALADFYGLSVSQFLGVADAA